MRASVNEAGERLQDAGEETESSRLYDSLRQEFGPELNLLVEEASLSTTRVCLHAIHRDSGRLLQRLSLWPDPLQRLWAAFQEGFNGHRCFSGWALPANG